MAEEELTSCSSESKFINELYCELCFEDGKQVHGYCVNCKEYLCEKCYHGHKSSRYIHDHVLVDKYKKSNDSPLAFDRFTKITTTKCKSHIRRVVKFYCKSHDVFGCSTCFATVHKCCPKVEIILKKSEHNLEIKQCERYMTKLKVMMKKSKEMMKKLCSESEVQINNLTKTCSALSEKIEAVEVEILCSSTQMCKLYIEMKQAEKEVIILLESLKIIERKNVEKTFTFDANNDLKNDLNSTDNLGKILHQDKIARKISPRSNGEVSKKKATKEGEINVRLSDQSSNAWISGSARISKNRMIITECYNSRVKLVDISTNTVISELKVSSGPWDVTALSPTQAVITLPYKKKILFLRVENTLAIERQLIVRGDCHGITYSHARLLVTYLDDPRLEIINLCGKLIKSIRHDSDGRRLFDSPLYVWVSTDGKTIFVYDDIHHTTTSLTFDGVGRLYTQTWS